MNTEPQITIGMPVFNDIEFIEASLQSILAQTYADFQLIISDDGSTDGSADICRSYAGQDTRVHYIRQKKNLGISNNMKFLLNKAKTPYFMWAADDDLWHPDFLKKGISALNQTTNAIVAFCAYDTIDEQENVIKTIQTKNYSSHSPYQRLINLITHPDDGFGYGIFRTDMIQDVRFPTWWWPNKNTPYNNIYPTLCFYLSKGDYTHFSDVSLFYKRIKTQENTNHAITGQGNAFYETFAYIIRRFNLITFCSREIRRTSSVGLMLRVYPALFWRWFIQSSYQQVALAGSSFIKNRILRKR